MQKLFIDRALDYVFANYVAQINFLPKHLRNISCLNTKDRRRSKHQSH